MVHEFNDPSEETGKPVRAAEWAVFGFASSVCVLLLFIICFILAHYSPTIPPLPKAIAEEAAGAGIGLAGLLAYVRLRLVIRWATTN